MKNFMIRLVGLIAACGMLLALLTYSRAQADSAADVYQQDDYCTSETADTDTAVANESLLTSEASGVEDAEPSCVRCTKNSHCVGGVCDQFIHCCIYF